MAAGIAAIATVALSSAPAFANEDAMAHTTDSAKDWGGKALWTGAGDRLTVCDLKADGMSAEAYVKAGIEHKSVAEFGGKGKCDRITFDNPEFTTVHIRVCLLDRNLNQHHCSRWVAGSA